MRLFKIALMIVLLVQIGLAESPLVLVTKVDGKVQSGGKPLELLSYLSDGDKALVAQGAQLTLSYVKGGLRATIIGPATVEVKSDKPALISGNPSQLKLAQPAKRIGAVLPSNLDLGSGGSLRRGEVSLHLSRKIMPGEQRIEFTALPNFKDFRLIVENSSSFEKVYESESPVNGAFVIPASKLSPGQSYDFLLQATSEAGGSKEIKEESVAVLNRDLADKLLQQAEEVSKANNEEPDVTELLALYLSYGLDREALRLVERLSSASDPNDRLQELKKTLRGRLQYQN